LKEIDVKLNDFTRREFLEMLLGAGVGLAAGGMLLPSCKKAIRTSHKTLIIGFDGMDPGLLAQFMKNRKFPNIQKLVEVNGIRNLGTSNPPQSPVAWANFITGTNPGGHGLFDFIHRDPENYMPYLSAAQTHESNRKMRIGKYQIPLSGGNVENLRRGTAFWEPLGDEGIPATIYRVPSNFPPVHSGRAISGMGTPDLLGGYGSFTFFTEKHMEMKDLTGGKIVQIKQENGCYKCRIEGPEDTLVDGKPQTNAEITIWKDSVNPAVKISAGDTAVLLNEGEWSDWIRLRFQMLPHVSSTSGIVMFYVKKVHPHLQIYVTPVNIDPSNPALPISYPENHSKELAGKIGLFYTQGIPEATKALDHDILTDAEYIQQNETFYRSVYQIYEHELERFNSGVLFFYFSNTDLGSHMFWSAMDKKHQQYPFRPEYTRGMIEKIYHDMDRMLGLALKRMNEGDTVMVISDHGFAPFYKGFHLNSWLKENGYLDLTDEDDRDEPEFLSNVNWSSTRAYALGFNGLYINQNGREGNGIVSGGAEKKALMKEMREKLLKTIDPDTGQHTVSHVYFAEEIYSGRYVSKAPDMIVGYNRGYRASWETAIGKVPHGLISLNEQKWTGDHCVDPVHVPGIILSNRKIRINDPALHDVPVTALAGFGIEKTRDMTGRKIL
jgi:predicted AlkP superfamily phosphohydrolase/phosphomutase